MIKKGKMKKQSRCKNRLLCIIFTNNILIYSYDTIFNTYLQLKVEGVELHVFYAVFLKTYSYTCLDSPKILEWCIEHSLSVCCLQVREVGA